MRITETEIYSQIETLNHILSISSTHWSDINLFPDFNTKEIFDFGQSRYRRELEETLMRPKFYLKERPFGDCDDFTILFLSYWIKEKGFPMQSFLVLAGKERISHVYPILLAKTGNGKPFLIGMDALPKNEYGFVYTYPLMKIYSITKENTVGKEFSLPQFQKFLVDRNISVLYRQKK